MRNEKKTSAMINSNHKRSRDIVRSWPQWQRDVKLTKGSLMMTSISELLKQKKEIESQIDLNRKERHKKIGENIKTLRNSLSLTQEKLALSIGCERATITNIELGNQRATIDHIIDMAELFNVSLDEILNL